MEEQKQIPINEGWLRRVYELATMAEKEMFKLPGEYRVKMQWSFHLLGYLSTIDTLIKIDEKDRIKTIRENREGESASEQDTEDEMDHKESDEV